MDVSRENSIRMDVSRENSIIQAENFLTGSCWIPRTPVKQGLQQPKPICETRQQIQPLQTNSPSSERISDECAMRQGTWLEKGIFLEGYAQDSQTHHVGACCESRYSANASRDLDKIILEASKNSRDPGDIVHTCNPFYVENMSGSKISFQKLIAMQEAAGSTAAVKSSSTFNTAASSFPLAFFQACDQQFQSPPAYSSQGSLEPFSGQDFNIRNSPISEIPNYQTLIPPRPSIDLNSPPKAADTTSSSKISAQSAPITPDQSKKTHEGQMFDPIIPNTDETGSNREQEFRSQQNTDDTFASTSIQLQENHMSENGDNQEAQLNRTPPKTRKKKHRPKVVIEGQSKRTPKPRTPKPVDPEGIQRGKRKYVRKKVGCESAPAPSAEETTPIEPQAQAPSSTNSTREKRKYTKRRQVNETSNSVEEKVNETVEPRTLRRTRRSCKRSLNFDLEHDVGGESTSSMVSPNIKESCRKDLTSDERSQLTPAVRQAKQGLTEVGIAYELPSRVTNDFEGYLSLHVGHCPNPSAPNKEDPHSDKKTVTSQNEGARGKCRIVFSDATHDKGLNSSSISTTASAHYVTMSPSNSNCSNTRNLTQERGPKKQHLETVDEADLFRMKVTKCCYNSFQEYQELFWEDEMSFGGAPNMYFPAVHRKKRREKGQSSATSSMQLMPIESHKMHQACLQSVSCIDPYGMGTPYGYSASQSDFNGTPNHNQAIDVNYIQHRQNFTGIATITETEKLRIKRSKCETRASTHPICKELPTSAAKGESTSRETVEPEISKHPLSCMEALAADAPTVLKTKKRSKRNLLAASIQTNPPQHHQNMENLIDCTPGTIWAGMSNAETAVERIDHLDIASETGCAVGQRYKAIVPYKMQCHAENALVLYQRDGTMVPFQTPFDHIRKRKPRPKVDLDDETTRVWKLLLEDINSQGIDGTDEEKAKWWEEERRVFRGRADSFIARMHLVQGDRRFSAWKGSVVDSVVGVFLTQNVSDHLSSSAFMSLAARFPLKANGNTQSQGERLNIETMRTECCLMDNDAMQWHEITSKGIAGNQSSVQLKDFVRDEEKDINSSDISNNSSNISCSADHIKIRLLDAHANDSDAIKTNQINKSHLFEEFEKFLASEPCTAPVQTSEDAQNIERPESYTQSTLESEVDTSNKLCNSPTSFTRLLLMAETAELHGGCSEEVQYFSSSTDDPQQRDADSSIYHQDSQLETNSNPANSCYDSSVDPMPSVRIQKYAMCSQVAQDASRSFDLFMEKESVFTEQYGSSESSCHIAYQHTMSGDSEEQKRADRRDDSCSDHQSEVNQRLLDYGEMESQVLVPRNSLSLPKIRDATDISASCMESTVTTSFGGDPRKLESSTHESKTNNQTNQNDMIDEAHTGPPKAKRRQSGKDKQNKTDWDSLRKEAEANGKRERTSHTQDSLDWEAVRSADVADVANTIKERGMNNMLAERIKDFLDRIVREHGSIDLEWLRDVPPDKAKEYLLSIRGLGLKSVECVRLLTLHHLAFPVDTNVGRIAVRLGWVPLQPLPESLQLHLLELYPILESIQKYLWPRLCKLDQRTLYELHYQMITFGKVFCTKSKPNCNACPMRGECRHFASAFASARLALPAPEERSIVPMTGSERSNQTPAEPINLLQLPQPPTNQIVEELSHFRISEPIIEVPATPEPTVELPASPEAEDVQVQDIDIEDAFFEDPDVIPTIKLNMVEFAQNVEKFVQKGLEIHQGDMSKALVALPQEAASIPTPKLKNISRLRTEHQVYELPDSHPLLEGLDKREQDDPCSYLLAIWTPGETADSVLPPESRCSSQESGKLCDDETCFSCNSIREAHSQTVRGTLLIPCRTAMRGSFPLNGTYFQVNEVFADHDSSLNPIDVPRSWLWNLPRRTVYFGTSIPTIFKGLSTESIQYCFWRGFVCVRGFDRKKRAPRPLIARLHFPASKLNSAKGKMNKDQH